MAILASDWMLDERIIALGADHLAVRCSLAALAAAYQDGTLGPVTDTWAWCRLLPGIPGVGPGEAREAWRAIVKAGLVVEYQAGGKTYGFIPEWFVANRASKGVSRSSKTMPIPDDIAAKFPDYMFEYLQCRVGKIGKRLGAKTSASLRAQNGAKPRRTAQDRERARTVLPSSSSSPSSFPSSSPSASQQAGLHPDAGWPACWDQQDPKNEVPEDIRRAIEREWSRSGGNGTASPSTAAKALAAVRISEGDARDGLEQMGLKAAPVRKPGAYLLDLVRKRDRDRAAAEHVRAHAEARRNPAPVVIPHENRRGIHATIWEEGGKPKTWETCSCSACAKGRAEPVGALGAIAGPDAGQAPERPVAATG